MQNSLRSSTVHLHTSRKAIHVLWGGVYEMVTFKFRGSLVFIAIPMIPSDWYPCEAITAVQSIHICSMLRNIHNIRDKMHYFVSPVFNLYWLLQAYSNRSTASCREKTIFNTRVLYKVIYINHSAYCQLYSTQVNQCCHSSWIKWQIWSPMTRANDSNVYKHSDADGIL